MGRKTGLKENKKEKKRKIKGVCGQTQLFRELCLSSTKNIYIIYSQNNLYKCHKGHVMFQDKRPSLLLTFVKRMKLLALICFKFKGTSGLTGSRGHRGHTVLHEERPS